MKISNLCKKHPFVAVFLALFAMTILSSCGKEDKGAVGQQNIKIGVAGAHSGDLASYGLPTVKAAELVVNEVNAKGGILGRQIELLVEDDA